MVWVRATLQETGSPRWLGATQLGQNEGDKFQQRTTFQGNILLVWAPSGWPEFLPPAELRL